MNRRMAHGGRGAAWAVALLAAVLAGVAGGRGAETAHPPVLAGCEPDYPPYCIVSPAGGAGGFSVELLRAALEAMGQKVAFKTGPWVELKEDLAAGRIEVLPLVGRTPEREAVYDFTFPYLTMHGTIVVRNETADIQAPADLKGRRVAVLQGDNAEEYLRRANVGALLVPRPSFETALRELAAGEHDAVVIQKLVAYQLMKKAGLTNLRTVGPPLKEFTQSFCFAVCDGDDELLAVLNEGLSIVMADGTFRRLYAHWFADLEAAERSRSRLIVGGDGAYPPYEFLDDQGRPSGFNVELTRAIARQMGVEVEIRLGDWSAVVEEFQSGGVDAMQGMFYTTERDQAFDFSPPHTMVPNTIVVRRGTPAPAGTEDLRGKAILVEKGDLLDDVARHMGYEAQLMRTTSQEEALRRLAAGEGDCALVGAVPALYWIKKNGWRNLVVARTPVLVAEYCYAVPHGREDLRSLFSQGLAALKETGEYQQIQARWFSPYDAAAVNFRAVSRVVMLFAGPLLVLLVGALLWSRTLQRRVDRRTRDLAFKNALLTAQSEATPDGILVVDEHGHVIQYNARFGQMWRIPATVLAAHDRERMEACALEQLADGGRFLENIRRMNADLTAQVRDELHFKDGRVFEQYSAPLTSADGRNLGRVWYYHDITERRRTEARRELALKVMATLNRGNNTPRMIGDILQLIKEGSGVEAVGIRLREGDAFPYFEINGFAGTFAENERELCARTEAGGLLRDARGRVRLECLCGAVLHGQVDSALPGFTPHGSFWTGSVTEWFAALPDLDGPCHIRQQCGRAGYETLALIPVRAGEEIIGLIQFNDRRKDLLSADTVRFFEGLGSSIGIALNRRRAMEQVHAAQAETTRLLEMAEQSRRVLLSVVEDQKAAQDALRANEEYIRAVLDALPFGVAVNSVDPTVNFTYMNGSFARIYRTTRDAVASPDGFWEAVYEDPVFREEMRTRVLSDIASGDPARMHWEDVPLIRTGQETTYISAHNTPVPGTPLMISTVWDVTERKRGEEERERLQSQLGQSQKMESVGRLAGGVAHDFNNLLQAILGFTELLLARADPRGDTYPDLKEIEKAAKRAAELTRQLLAFGRKQRLEPRVLDINQNVADMGNMLRRLLGEDIRFVTQFAPDLKRVFADPGQIEQIVMNLAVNARDAMPGGGRLTISTANVTLEHVDTTVIPDARPGQYVCLSVSDTGEGIDDAILPHIFEPFFTTKEQGKGTGLGLAVIYGAVKQSGGWVNVYSEKDQGTTFRVYLPAYAPPSGEPEVEAGATTAAAVPKPRGRGERILLVEDEAGVRNLAVHALTSNGYEVFACENAQDALALCKRERGRFDLLFSDVVLPGQTGIELADEIRRQNPGLPVLLCSGYTDDRARWSAIENKKYVFLQKPYPVSVLRRTVREILDAAAPSA